MIVNEKVINKMKELIEDLKSKKYSFIASVVVNKKTKKPLYRYVIHKILGVTEEGVSSISNLVTGGLKILHRFPTEGNYEMVEDGYIERVDCGKYGVHLKKTVFLKDITSESYKLS